MRQTRSKLRGVEVVQHADTQNQIVLLAQPHAVEGIDRAEPDVAARSESAHHIFAGVYAGVLNAWSQAAKRREPVRLAASDIEDTTERSAEDVLSGPDDERHLSCELLRRLHAVAGVAVPLVEIPLIVMTRGGHLCMKDRLVCLIE